jgi:hypothetical protein
MSKHISLLIVVAAGMSVGCSGSGSGDIGTAHQASMAAPKSADQLPATMPKEAKASAASAMGQAQAEQQRNSDPARLKALKMMKLGQ